MKKQNILKLNLQLFNEEGIESNTVVTDSQPQEEPVVVYGKGEETETISQEVTTEGEEIEEEETEAPAQPNREELYKQYKEEYKDLYSQDFQKHFDRRFKEHKQVQQKVEQYQPIIENLMAFHGVESIEDLQKVIDEDVLSDLAEAEGFSDVKKYKEFQEYKRKSSEYDNRTQEEREQQEYEEKAEDWLKQGEALRKSIPTFDLAAEIDNDEFVKKLEMGLSVEEAYFLTHKDDYLKSTIEKAQKKTVDSIKAKQKRIIENGTQKTPGVIRKTDPSQLSDKELADIAIRVANGERIIF